MNVTTMKMAYPEAKAALDEYTAGLEKNPCEEWIATRRAYLAMSKGKAIIDVIHAFEVAGLDEKNRPKLAIARADVTKIRYECYNEKQEPKFLPIPHISYQARFTLPSRFYKAGVGGESHQAVVPSIPPRFYPGPSALTKYWILWEPEWHQVPADPLLLRKLVGTNLYVVVAAWDLTEVEMAVLRGRLK
jgi:hypothetical protein